MIAAPQAPKSAQDRQREIEAKKATIKAADRLRRIAEARKRYLPFVHLMMPDPLDPDDINLSRYHEAHFHTLLGEQLEKVERGESLRTIITMPPGHGKSELAAKKFIPWFLGRDPYRHSMFAGYSDEFAQGTGKSVRDCMDSNLYRQAFPLCRLMKGSKSSSFFKTTEGGESFFVGVGGAATGRRAHLLVIDDPIKNREDADSPSFRQKLWDWFNQVAMTRLADHSARVIIIQTRWHEDDLVGRLIDPDNDHYSKETAAQWEVFELPALARQNDPLGRKPGEPLWPEKFNLAHLESARRQDPRGFEALQQGRPAPEDGDFFRKEWIQTYEPAELPENLTMYCASDHAVSEKQTSDFTVMIPFGVDARDNIYLMPNVFWARKNALEVAEAMITLMQRYNPVMWTAENGHISKAIGPFLRKLMNERSVYCSIQELTPTKSKMQRAQSIQGRMSMGKVFFPKYAHWLAAAESELLKFPSAKHDDFVDALAWCGITLGQQYGAPNEVESSEEEPASGTFAWLKRSEEWEKRQKDSEYQDGF